MQLTVYAGYLIDSKQLNTWSQAQTNDVYVKCREQHRTGTLLTLRHYLSLQKQTSHIGVDIFPYPADDTGRTTDDNWYIMLYLHKGEYDVHLRRFGDWQKYEQDESDAQLRGIIDDLGIPTYGDVTWKVVAWVGRIGLFYDFSPKVITDIYGHMEAYKVAKAQRAAQQTRPPAMIA